MYKVKGGDEKVYGPVSGDQLRAWVRESRLNRDSLIERVDNPGWKPLGQWVEFADLFGASTGAPPAQPFISPPPARDEFPDAAGSVRPAAISLMIYGGISLLLRLGSLGFRPSQMMNLSMFDSAQGVPPGFKEILQRAMSWSAASYYPDLILGFALAVGIVYGGYQMYQLRNRTWAIVAGCISVVPCFSACCCLGIPLGVWALVVLARPEVKQAFEKR